MAGLFERLDRDHSGDLHDVELASGPWSQLSNARPRSNQQPLAQQLQPQPFTMLDFDVEAEDDRVSFSEFLSFLGPYCSSLEITSAPANAGNPYSAGGVSSPTPWSGIGERLDIDDDQALTLAEVADPIARLRPLDADDDETFNLWELNPELSPINFRRRVVQVGSRAGADRPAAIGQLPEEAPGAFVRRLIATYDSGPEGEARDGKLSGREWPASSNVFMTIDTNQDIQLDASELLAWYAQLTPEVETIVRCDQLRSERPTVEAFRARGVASPAPAAVELVKTKEGLVARWTTSEVEIRASQTVRANSADSQKKVFLQADGDKNGYIDEAESRNYVPTAFFANLDADGNKMIFEEEWIAFYNSLEEIAFSRSIVRVGDNGSSMFERLDANNDARLSTREWRNLKKLAEHWDRDDNGSIVAEDMPRRYRIDVGGSTSNTNQLTGVVFFAAATMPTMPMDESAPAWSQAMDRNSDGDISRREFLNNRAAFDRLDADHDELISAAEAKAAK